MFSSMLSLLGSLRRGNFVQNSLRFRSSASAYLSRTPSAIPTSGKIWTWSAWIKRGTLNTTQALLSANSGSGYSQVLYFDLDNTLKFATGPTIHKTTPSVFRDAGAFYHIVVVGNSTQLTGSNRLILYVNGVQQTWNSTTDPGFDGIWNIGAQNILQGISFAAGSASSVYFDGYLTEVNFIDGQALTPSSFGQIESTTGVWSPKQYVGSYGTNGFYLKFADASAATAAAIGKDSSGNGNNWTPSGISVTAGATYDSMLDVPVNYSDGGNGRGNYAVLNPLDKVTTATLAAANLETTSAAAQNIIGSMSMDSGSWYWEIAYSAATASQLVGVYKATATTVSVTPTTSVIGLRFNADTGALDYTVNGSTYTSIATGLTGGGYFPYAGSLTNAKVIYANFGQRPFTYTPPAGFKALNTNNLPTPSIVNGANFMAATTYTGNAAARSLSNAVNNVSFQPDLVWIKSRTPGVTNHALFDSSRGVTKYLSSNTTTAETTLAQSLTAFNADGFSLGTDTTLVNASANSYVAWQWKESITAGFDIVTYTGNGANRTIAHNLGVAPAMVIVKRYDAPNTGNWQIRHRSIAATDSIQLNATSAAAAAATVWNSTAPTSSVFSVGTSTDVNATGGTYAAYCFAEIAGFSKFNSYTGNGSADGPFVFCGFRPRFVMVKRTDVANNWFIYDSSRNSFNVVGQRLVPDAASEEVTLDAFDFTSNGFKLRTSDAGRNATGGTYIFATFAEVPSKYALAR